MKAQMFNTPVLFLVFNRPNSTQRVFEMIRKVKPARLYIASDGPRSDRVGEAVLVDQVRSIATAVDWPCDIYTLFRDDNLGCRHAVSSAISWFFDNEECGIVLEDDCLPHIDFFYFCELLLVKYRNDSRIGMISGANFQGGINRGDSSYYFSKYNHIWGWASWRRAWLLYDVKIKFWPEWRQSSDWRRMFLSFNERLHWENVFELTYQGKIDTWDYQWMASLWRHGRITAVPNVNLVSNIGFGQDATHTHYLDSPLANLPTQYLTCIDHPETIELNEEADAYVFNNAILNGAHMSWVAVCTLWLRLRARLALGRLKKNANSCE